MKQINTPLQDKFLKHLFDEDVKGNVRKAMKKAGYSDTSASKDVVESLKDQIIELAQLHLASNAVNAVFGLLDTIETPSQVGANNKIKAATEVLDRAGVIKKEPEGLAITKGAIFFLPPKDNSSVELPSPMPEPDLIDQ